MRPPMDLAEYSPETRRLFTRFQVWQAAVAVVGIASGGLAMLFPHFDRTPVVAGFIFGLALISLGLCVPMARASGRFRRAGYAERDAIGR